MEILFGLKIVLLMHKKWSRRTRWALRSVISSLKYSYLSENAKKKKTNRAISTLTVAVFFLLFFFVSFCFCFFWFWFFLFCFCFVLCFFGVTQNFGIGTVTVNNSCALM